METISLNRFFQDFFNDIYYVIIIKNFSFTYTMSEDSFRFLMVIVSVKVSEYDTIKVYI